MSLTTGALTTVAQVKSLLIDKTSVPAGHDSLLEFYIEAMSDRIESYVGRILEFRSYVERYIGHGRQILLLKQWPIASVTYVKDDGSTIPAAEYVIMPEEGMLFKEGGWLGGALGLRSLPLDEVHPNAARYNLEVSYSAGYKTPNFTTPTERNLPFDLELACGRLVAGLYLNRDKEGMSRLSNEGWSSDFDRWPLDVVAILNHYKREG
jgi:hypothetical protein